jgi:hypothetical protein
MRKLYVTPETSYSGMEAEEYLLTGSIIGTSVYDNAASGEAGVLSRRQIDIWSDDDDLDSDF